MSIRSLIAGLAVIAVIAGTPVGCGSEEVKPAAASGGDEKGATTAKADGGDEKAGSGGEMKPLPADLVNKTCPMSGEALAAGWVLVTHKDKKVGLCCSKCAQTFAANADALLAKAMGDTEKKSGSGSTD